MFQLTDLWRKIKHMSTSTNNTIKNKIDADDRSIRELLDSKKFTIDYFQREYRWTDKNIKALIEDLTTTFLKNYDPAHKRSDVKQYANYYLGPVVLLETDEGTISVIDGQQRITSISLLLIYLIHLQKDLQTPQVNISDLVFSESYGEKSFNLSDDNRTEILTSLLAVGNYQISEEDDETVINMYNRYMDLVENFPDELAGNALPYFIDWLKDNVILVEIKAYSEENAYLIFETMNDRGLNLTQTEMLKGYILSKIKDATKRNEINILWKKTIQEFNKLGKDADLSFFQAWFRGKYALTIRPGKAGSENQDFENIGSVFHKWFKENHEELLELKTSDDFYNFCKNDFAFFAKWYLISKDAQSNYTEQLANLNYINYWGIAESLQDPLLLSSLKTDDNEETIKLKLKNTAHYIENFTVRRAVNFRKFGQTAIKYTMFNLMKKIRNNSLEQLAENLTEEIEKIDEKWIAVRDFGMHGMNKAFVKHLLCRITSHIDQATGKNTTYASYHHPTGKQYEIEHLWADKFSRHTDEFDQKGDFAKYRNYIGDLILLPNGTNQSFNSDIYEDKLKFYLRENTYAQSLHHDTYSKNPNFLNSPQIQKLTFEPFPYLKKADILKRNELVERICEQIWSVDFFEKR